MDDYLKVWAKLELFFLNFLYHSSMNQERLIHLLNIQSKENVKIFIPIVFNMNRYNILRC